MIIKAAKQWAQAKHQGQTFNGDKVWLKGCNLHTDQPLAKLSPKCHGSFQIKKVLSPVTYQLTPYVMENAQCDVDHLTPYTLSQFHQAPTWPYWRSWRVQGWEGTRLLKAWVWAQSTIFGQMEGISRLWQSMGQLGWHAWGGGHCPILKRRTPGHYTYKGSCQQTRNVSTLTVMSGWLILFDLNFRKHCHDWMYQCDGQNCNTFVRIAKVNCTAQLLIPLCPA